MRRSGPDRSEMAPLPPRMRICLVYDCLYPWTVGGAERWYRDLAAELVAAGHEVTYLTRRQWDERRPAADPGRRGRRGRRRASRCTATTATAASGRRCASGGASSAPAAPRGRYDVVHTCAFPYFSLLAARAALAGTRTQLGVDWFEVWTRELLAVVPRPRRRHDRAPRPAGVRRAVTTRAFVFSRLHARRLAEEGLRGEPVTLAGLYAGPTEARPSAGPREPLVVFAGRHIAEKRVPSIPAAIAAARERVPGLRARVFGDGPQRAVGCSPRSTGSGSQDVVEAPGFVDGSAVERGIREATLPAAAVQREGYGLVVIEAASVGTPSVVVRGPDNAATELVADGVNGYVAATHSADDVARRDRARSTSRATSCGAARPRGSPTRRPRSRQRPRPGRVLRRLRAGGRRLRSARAVRSHVKRAARARPQRAEPVGLAQRPLDRRPRARGAPRGRPAARRRRRPPAATTGSTRPRARRAPSPRAPAGRSPRRATGRRPRRRARRGASRSSTHSGSSSATPSAAARSRSTASYGDR